MICENFHVNTMPGIPPGVHSGDRFLVAKFLAPKRWDIVVFQYPPHPETLYVMRLVGLPGETIHIEDGAVHANGTRLTVPDTLRGIEYVAQFPESYVDVWGSKDKPAVLGPDEYFVLGDFSYQSSDSRFWRAVPESHLRGVVTHIYWPPERWRVLR
jgi:signal peptidase I